MRKKIIVILGILMLSCENVEQNKLENSLTLKETFNKKDVSELSKVLNFFDNQIELEFNSQSLMESYYSFYKKSLDQMNQKRLYINFSFAKQDSFFKNLNKTTISKIWSHGKSFREKDTLDIISLKINGNYIKFLELLSKENNLIEDYANQLVIAADITPENSYFFITNYDSLNLNNENIRLMMAIHYLTLNNMNR